MLRWIIISLFLGSISGCAAIQGAQGDAVIAKQTTAAQAAASKDTDDTDSQSTASSGSSTPPSERASTNAAKLIAPLTH